MIDRTHERIILRGGEARDFDYKGPMAWDKSDLECLSLVKDVLAMANTVGGYIVVGVSESADRGWEWQGLDSAQLPGWDQTKIGDVLREYADPPVEFTVIRVEYNGRPYVIIAVEPFRKSPHICKKSYEKPGVKGNDRFLLRALALYVRTESAQSAPIQTADQFQDLIERAVRNRQDQMLEAMRSILTGASLSPTASDRERFEEQIADYLKESKDPYPDKGYDAYFTDVMFPSRFLVTRFSFERLREASQDTSVNYRGWPFLFYRDGNDAMHWTNDGLQFELTWQPWAGTGNNLDSYEFWQLRRSGLFIRKTLVFEEARYKSAGYRILDPDWLVNHLAEAVDALARLYTALGVTDEDITWKFSLTGTEARELQLISGNRPFRRGHVSRIPMITHEQTHSIEDWKAGIEDHALLAAQEILLRFGWDLRGEGPYRQRIRDLFSRRM